MSIFLAVIEFLKKILDFITPWSGYWVDKKKHSNAKKEDAKKRMDEAIEKGDYDEFLDSRAERDSA